MTQAIRLSREIRFYLPDGKPDLSESNFDFKNSHSGWLTSNRLNPFLKLQTEWIGEIDSKLGVLCNVKLVDDLFENRLVPKLQHLTDHVRSNPIELLKVMNDELTAESIQGATLDQVHLQVSPSLKYSMQSDCDSQVTLTEQFEFSAAHRLHCDALSDEENRKLFGKCNNPNGHGHNYVVEVSVNNPFTTGPMNEQSDFVDLHRLEQIVKETVIDRYDHKHLNEDLDDFAKLNPTVENITQVIWNLLSPKFQPGRLAKVRVYETPKTWAERSSDS